MSNSIAPGSSADVNVRVTALTTNPNVPVTYKTIILKKNLVNGVNTLTQEMMSTTNTKYVVKYDYVLGEDITIPANCVLEFEGGSISAGSGENMDTITGNNTSINASLVKIFNTDVTLAGSWNVTEAYPKWFGAKVNDNTNDARLPIQKCIDSFRKVKLQGGSYHILSNSNGVGIRLQEGSSLIGSCVETSPVTYQGNFIGTTLQIGSTSGVLKGIEIQRSTELKNIQIIGYESEPWNYTSGDALVGVGYYEDVLCYRIRIEKVRVSNCIYGFDLGAFNIGLVSCNCMNCFVGFYLHSLIDTTSYTGIFAANCASYNCACAGFYIKNIVYSTFNSCSVDELGYDANGNPISVGNLISGAQSTDKMKGAYYLRNCVGITFNSCGCEKSKRALYIVGCFSIAFNKCAFFPSYNYTDEIASYLAVNSARNTLLDIDMRWDEASGPAGWHNKFLLYTPQTGAIYPLNVFKNISVLNTTLGAQSENALRSVLFTEADRTYDNSFVSIESCSEYEYTYRVNINENLAYGNVRLNDHRHNCTIHIVGDGSHALSLSTPFIADGFKKIIFENLVISLPTPSAEPEYRKNFYLNFKNTSVEFRNVKFLFATSTSYTDYIIKSENSDVVFWGSTYIHLNDQTYNGKIIDGAVISGIATVNSLVPYNIANLRLPQGMFYEYENGDVAIIGRGVNGIVNAKINKTVDAISNLPTFTSAKEKTLAVGSSVFVTGEKKTVYYGDDNKWYDSAGNEVTA